MKLLKEDCLGTQQVLLENGKELVLYYYVNYNGNQTLANLEQIMATYENVGLQMDDNGDGILFITEENGEQVLLSALGSKEVFEYQSSLEGQLMDYKNQIKKINDTLPNRVQPQATTTTTYLENPEAQSAVEQSVTPSEPKEEVVTYSEGEDEEPRKSPTDLVNDITEDLNKTDPNNNYKIDTVDFDGDKKSVEIENNNSDEYGLDDLKIDDDSLNPTNTPYTNMILNQNTENTQQESVHKLDMEDTGNDEDEFLNDLIIEKEQTEPSALQPEVQAQPNSLISSTDTDTEFISTTNEFESAHFEESANDTDNKIDYDKTDNDTLDLNEIVFSSPIYNKKLKIETEKHIIIIENGELKISEK